NDVAPETGVVERVAAEHSVGGGKQEAEVEDAEDGAEKAAVVAREAARRRRSARERLHMCVEPPGLGNAVAVEIHDVRCARLARGLHLCLVVVEPRGVDAAQLRELTLEQNGKLGIAAAVRDEHLDALALRSNAPRSCESETQSVERRSLAVVVALDDERRVDRHRWIGRSVTSGSTNPSTSSPSSRYASSVLTAHTSCRPPSVTFSAASMPVHI